MSYYTVDEQAAMDRDCRNMAAGGVPLSGELETLREVLTSGNLGITSAAYDVDSLALGGGACSRNKTAAPGTSLLFAWYAGRIMRPLGVTVVSAGSIALAASSNNYIEADGTGTVFANTAGFTAGRCPLYVVTTGVSSYTDAQVVGAKALLSLIGPGGINGAMLSGAAQTKEITAQIGTISAATTLLIPTPSVAAIVSAIRLAASVAIAQSDANYWTMAVANLGPSGAGATPVTGSTTTNSTKLTGGSPIAAGVARSLALSATAGATSTAAGDVLQVTLTPTGAPTNLTLAAIAIDLTFTA